MGSLVLLWREGGIACFVVGATHCLCMAATARRCGAGGLFFCMQCLGVGETTRCWCRHAHHTHTHQGDEDDDELEHGRAHDDMWSLDLKKYTVRGAGRGVGSLVVGLGRCEVHSTRRHVGPGPQKVHNSGGFSKSGDFRGVGSGAVVQSAAGVAQGWQTAPSPLSPAPPARAQWERVKKAGMAPGPRASFAWAVHKGMRAFLFGGVSDNEAKGGEDLSSEFHNDLYTFSFGNRWGRTLCVVLDSDLCVVGALWGCLRAHTRAADWGVRTRFNLHVLTPTPSTTQALVCRRAAPPQGRGQGRR